MSNKLIGFERADIRERNNYFPAEALEVYARSRAERIQPMIKNITRPLQQQISTGALRKVVADTESLIGRGDLQNEREVEVTLIANGRVSSKLVMSSAASLC